MNNGNSDNINENNLKENNNNSTNNINQIKIELTEFQSNSTAIINPIGFNNPIIKYFIIFNIK